MVLGVGKWVNKKFNTTRTLENSQFKTPKSVPLFSFATPTYQIWNQLILVCVQFFNPKSCFLIFRLPNFVCRAISHNSQGMFDNRFKSYARWTEFTPINLSRYQWCPIIGHVIKCSVARWQSQKTRCSDIFPDIIQHAKFWIGVRNLHCTVQIWSETQNLIIPLDFGL